MSARGNPSNDPRIAYVENYMAAYSDDGPKPEAVTTPRIDWLVEIVLVVIALLLVAFVIRSVQIDPNVCTICRTVLPNLLNFAGFLILVAAVIHVFRQKNEQKRIEAASKRADLILSRYDRAISRFDRVEDQLLSAALAKEKEGKITKEEYLAMLKVIRGEAV